MDKMFLIPAEGANILLRYLASKPYAEVSEMVHFLQSLQEMPKACECPPEGCPVDEANPE